MPYIGKAPISGGFHKLDSLTASATATYALTLGSAAYYPETANQLLVSLNGVIQAPQDSFTVSGSNLVFDSALTSSDSIDFVMALGDVLGVGTPTDGSVTTAKIGNNAVTDAKIDTMAASKLTGALPAIDGSNLTGLSGSNVKEVLAMLCDGQSYTVSSGTYTPTNVTSSVGTNSSFGSIAGSAITYTPPSGTTAVLYEFIFALSAATGSHNILSARLHIDGTEVTDSRTHIGANSNLATIVNWKYVIPIGGTGSTATGRQATWTTGKSLEIQGRRHNTANEPRLHGSYYYNGATSNQFHRPSLIITAYG